MTEIKIGQVRKNNEGMIEVITDIYTRDIYDADGNPHEEVFCCGLNNNGSTFDCEIHQAEAEFEIEGSVIIATYPSWIEAIHSPEFKGE